MNTPTTTPATAPAASPAPTGKILQDLPQTPAPKAVRAAKTPKTPKAAKPHQPSTVERTEANPAKSIVPERFKAKYAAHEGSCGDEVAYAIKAAIYTRNDDGREVLSMKALQELAEANGIDFGAYAKLNNGQKSMNVRNRLRGMLKAGKTIVVGKRKFADKAKALAVRPVETKSAEATA